MRSNMIVLVGLLGLVGCSKKVEEPDPTVHSTGPRVRLVGPERLDRSGGAISKTRAGHSKQQPTVPITTGAAVVPPPPVSIPQPEPNPVDPRVGKIGREVVRDQRLWFAKWKVRQTVAERDWLERARNRFLERAPRLMSPHRTGDPVETLRVFRSLLLELDGRLEREKKELEQLLEEAGKPVIGGAEPLLIEKE